MLFDLYISLEVGERYPKKIEEIGLSSLLYVVYSSSVKSDYRKANFYEKIYQLDELGISNIEFRPNNFVDRIDWIAFLRDVNNGKVIGINKCFIDWEFDVIYPDNPLSDGYEMTNFRDVNYLINVLVRSNIDLKKSVIDSKETYVVLKKFNGSFTNKESIEETRYPWLCFYD